MWKMVRELRENGVTIILTTHYIEEAQEMADRIGVINKGEIILVEEKERPDAQARQAQLTLQLQRPLDALPAGSQARTLELSHEARSSYTFDAAGRGGGDRRVAAQLGELGIEFKDLQTERELARGHLRQPGEERHEYPRDQLDLSLRDGAHVPHRRAEHRCRR